MTPFAPNRGAKSRTGFTLIETMVVLVIAGIVLSMSLPKMAAMRDRMSVRAAKQQFSSYLATTRAVAIRQSQTAQLHVQQNHMWSTVDQPNGTNISVGKRIRLLEQFGVYVTRGDGSTPDDIVSYDARGMSNSGGHRTYVLTKNNYQDSICVSRVGLVALNCGQ